MTEPVIQPAVQVVPEVGRTVRGARIVRMIGPAAVVSVAFLLANGLSYVFTVVAARSLAPGAYGELAALLSVLLVGTVPATGLQTAAALHLGGRRATGDVTARLHACGWLVGLGTCVVGMLATVPLAALLHLPDSTVVLWVVLLMLPHTLFAVHQGVLQGTGRYRALAGASVFFGAAKLAGGLGGLVLGGTPGAALAGMTVGTSMGAFVGWLVTDRPGLAGRLRGPLTSALHASAALLGFVVLVNLDLLLARHHLSAQLAGEYAVASIFAKVAFWLPQGVGVVLLPRLGDAQHRRRVMPRAVGLVGAAGGLLVLGTAALGPLALPLVGGTAYGSELGGWTWVFALLGTLFAVAQLLLYSRIAAADRLGSLAVWSAAALETLVVAVLAGTDRLSVLTLVSSAVGTALLLVAVGLVRLQHTPSAAEL